MKNFNQMKYYPLAEELVEILQTKTQNTNPLFFRVIVAYYLSVIASQMRASIKGWIGKEPIPVNSYVIALQPSGAGKGHSTTMMSQEVLKGFRETFIEHTFPITAECNIQQLAIKRANKTGKDIDEEQTKLEKVFNDLGALMFEFDSATVPAIKQMRQKLLIANAGACNLTVDEAGANLSGSIDAMIAYLELYDKGLIRDKLVKSSSENTRFERIEGHTPTNLLMFGTPSKLLDGGKTEEQFYELLEMGYARRCLFGFTNQVHKAKVDSVDELMKTLFNTDHDDSLERIAEHITLLADPDKLNSKLTLSTDSIKLLLTYKLYCENLSAELSEFEAIRKAELEHRYFKAMKLAGAYAFVDGKDTITPEYIEYAIRLVEDSGEAFNKLLTPQRPYIKLANYLASVRHDVTLADLDEDLPSFRGSKAQKDEMIQMAIAWGYKNNIVIKKSYTDSIMFLNADTIDETNLDEMILSFSKEITENYKNQIVPFDKVDKLLTKDNYHWLSHHLVDGYRKEYNCQAGFNLLVLDIDGTCSLSTAQLLLKGYKAIFQTTKSHKDDDPHFRIILPINYTLKLDAKDYKEMYNAVIAQLPFDVDTQCNQRSRKWETNKNATIIHQDGELFDILPFIPKTTKNEERQSQLRDQEHLDNLERWVINNTGDGNRNNMLLRYAMVLVDSGYKFDTVKDKVIGLNNKLIDKLDELELHSTIFHTVAKKLVA
ncbi:DUF3987 domain-containing protein [Moraxella bovis]|uniref:DUF3987 domain-containing protein n=1 Tax=Moraxella bovis TaxID=476 RepID=UPI00223F3577|nr:DUF3987 domain-containing protein [Moraxella bovis]UZA54059.1 DUF3987 domain-containing protein [Moraxella bovis]